jgi:hypothetical protein
MKNEGMTTSMVEQQTRKIPSMGFLGLAMGAMAISAGLALAGKVKLASFVGQWAPTILILGTYNKIAKTFSAPYDEGQRLQHGGHASTLKSPSEFGRTPPPLQST